MREFQQAFVSLTPRMILGMRLEKAANSFHVDAGLAALRRRIEWLDQASIDGFSFNRAKCASASS